MNVLLAAALAAAVGCVFAAGCGTGGRSLDGEVGTYAPGPGGLTLPGDAAGAQPLDALIEQDGVGVKLVTLSCSGDCATVQAEGTGGNPPYTFAWEDGSTNPVRQVCPTADTSYSVTVRDTGATGEFPRPAETASASVGADVVACPGPSDAGLPADGGCVSSMLGSAAASCTPPSSANVYPLYLPPLVAHVPVSFRVTGTGTFIGGSPWHFEVWGSPDGCTLGERLGAFQLANGPFAIDVCATPMENDPYVILVYRLSATDGASVTPLSVSLCGACD